METVTGPEPLPPPPVPSNGWYLNSENIQALNSQLATENQAREAWRLLSLHPVPEVLRWVDSRQQKFNSAPSNDLEDQEPAQREEEEMGEMPNELNEPEKPEEEGGWEQLDQEGEILISKRNGNQAGGASRANCAGSGRVHGTPTTTNPTRGLQNGFTIRVGCLIRDRSDPDYWRAATRLFTNPAARGPSQQAERFVVTTTFALSFSSPIISITPHPHLGINGQMVHGGGSTHPSASNVTLNNRWIDQTAPLPPRDPYQRSQSPPAVRAMEGVIHRTVYTMTREFEQRYGLPRGGITSVFVKLGELGNSEEVLRYLQMGGSPMWSGGNGQHWMG